MAIIDIYIEFSGGNQSLHVVPGAAPGCLLWGGGGGKMAKCLAEHCASPKKKKALSGGGGGGGGDPTHFFPTETFCGKNYYHNGVRVLSSSPYVTELTSKKKKIKNHRGNSPLPPPPLTPRLCRSQLHVPNKFNNVGIATKHFKNQNYI